MAVVCYEGHLEGFMRYAELADAIERWLEETGRRRAPPPPPSVPADYVEPEVSVSVSILNQNAEEKADKGKYLTGKRSGIKDKLNRRVIKM
jgi:hypothetical protein